jgi:hypothetical protein
MYLTEDLIEQIKENTSTEFAQGRFSRDTIVNLCDQETIKRIAPIISGLQSEFFVITQSYALAKSTKRFRLPKRAAFRGVRELYLDISGTRYELSQITRETSVSREDAGEGIPSSFYFEADSIVFDVPLQVAATLVLCLEVSPGRLTLASNTTTVSSVDFTTGVVTLAGSPSGFGTIREYDFIEQLGYANAALGVGLTPISASGTTYTFTASELPPTLRVGDYVALGGYSPVPNMPDEAVVTLIHAVSCRVFRFRGDNQMLAAETQELTNSIIYLERALSDRVEGARTVLQGGTGLLKAHRIRRLGYL